MDKVKTIHIKVCSPALGGCGTIFLDDVPQCPCCARPNDACNGMRAIVLDDGDA